MTSHTNTDSNTEKRIVLAGDIGGTTTRLQIAEVNFNIDAPHSEIKILHRKKFQSNSSPDLIALIEKFLNLIHISPTQLYSACFAVAGPVVNGKIKFTNLPWELTEQDLKARLQLSKVKLINDFQAIGFGIDTLDNKDLCTLQNGKPEIGSPKALIGAGTGLGVGLMFYTDNHYTVIPTEGGHVDFAPTTGAQAQLLAYLRKKLHRVSVERVCSGMGLENIYHFVRDNPLYGEKENPDFRYRMHKGEDIAALVSEFASEYQDAMALRALRIFINIYGSTAGNLALTTLPRGGLYIVGGIAPKILQHIQNSEFMAKFTDKGRMSHLLERIPVHVVLETHVGLQGAANYAARYIES